MKKLICDICGKEIKSNETISVFSDGGTDKHTHTMENGNNYDCDYLYMMEVCCPKLYSNRKEYEENE
jgi:hypothetical protein